MSQLSDPFTLLPLTSTEFQGYRAAWGDYDNDGDLDLAVTGGALAYFGPGRVLRNDGEGSFSEVFLVGPCEWPEWVDLDSDGYLELVLAGVAGSHIYVYDRQGGFVRLEQQLAGVRALTVADFDNDGDVDLLLKGPSWTEGLVTRLYRNEGRNVFSVAPTIFPNLPSNGAMEWSDFDYDGDCDLLLGGEYEVQPLKLYRNDTPGVFAETLVNLPWDSRVVSWIDYDNDRRVDAILTGTRVFKNLGNSFSNVTEDAELCCGNNGVWGDFDGDGWRDVMISAPPFTGLQPGQIFRNLRDGKFAQIQSALSLVADDGSAWGDFDNDGDLDLVLVGQFAKLVRNNSAISNALPSIPTNLSATVLSGGQVLLNWSLSSDSGVWASITYNLRVGTRPGGIDVMSPEADLATGWGAWRMWGMRARRIFGSCGYGLASIIGACRQSMRALRDRSFRRKARL